MKLKTISILGAGQMGSGIAQVCAQAGYHVHLNDVSQDVHDTARCELDQRLTRLVERGKLNAEDRANTLARIITTRDPAEVGAAELIIDSCHRKRSPQTQNSRPFEPAFRAEYDFGLEHLIDLHHTLGRWD